MGKKILVVLRRMLLALCAVGVMVGIALVVMALLPQPTREAQAQLAAPMLVIDAGTVTILDEVSAVQPFEIDALEVSATDFATCVRAGGCQLSVSASAVWGDQASDRAMSGYCVGGRAERAAAPMNCVDWDAADAYCKWAGKRLPTREEWWHAIASKYPDAIDEVHRSAELPPGEWLRGEWTASMGRARGRGPWSSVRYAATRSLHPESSSYKKAASRSYGTSLRAPWLSFRCAR